MNDEAEQHGISGVRVLELVMMGLFAEMKVWGNRVLEEVNDQIAQENQKGR
jgi:hypothetical protein